MKQPAYVVVRSPKFRVSPTDDFKVVSFFCTITAHEVVEFSLATWKEFRGQCDLDMLERVRDICIGMVLSRWRGAPHPTFSDTTPAVNSLQRLITGFIGDIEELVETAASKFEFDSVDEIGYVTDLADEHLLVEMKEHEPNAARERTIATTAGTDDRGLKEFYFTV